MNPKDNLLNISYEYFNDKPLKLNDTGYEVEPPTTLYKNVIFYKNYNLNMIVINGMSLNFKKINSSMIEEIEKKYLINGRFV